MHHTQSTLKKAIKSVSEDPILFSIRILSLLYHIYLRIKSGVQVGTGLNLKGKPTIEILGSGRIYIGENVTLYSTKRQYFAHLASPVRLFAEDNSEIIIGSNTRINGATIHARKKIEIGHNCLIAANTSILDSNGHEMCLEDPEKRVSTVDEPKPICIEDAVWLGVNCIILKGVRIGFGSVIAAGSVVNSDIPPYSLASGNPAKPMRTVKMGD